MPKQAHHHRYMVKNQRTEPDKGNPPNGMITYIFRECKAPGTCDEKNVMDIRRWTKKR
jgi:hypothetical protein